MTATNVLAALSPGEIVAVAADVSACSELGEAVMDLLRGRVWEKVQDHHWVKSALAEGVTPVSFRPRAEGEKNTAVAPKFVWRCTMSDGSYIEFSQSIWVGDDFQVGVPKFMQTEEIRAKT